MHAPLLSVLLPLFRIVVAQDSFTEFLKDANRGTVDNGILTLKAGSNLEELEEEENEATLGSRDILIIGNHFPKRLNFFCQPRDRFCFRNLDAFLLLCPGDTPPLHMVPFCLGFYEQCARISFPKDTWCEKEYDHYRGYCTRSHHNKCKLCHVDVSCSCEPYACLATKSGTATAEWCQRYELFCDAEKRRKESEGLATLLEGAIRIHQRCFLLFNFAKVKCNPYRVDFDWARCEKFLFDCELISDFEEEDAKAKEPTAEEKLVAELMKEEAAKGSNATAELLAGEAQLEKEAQNAEKGGPFGNETFVEEGPLLLEGIEMANDTSTGNDTLLLLDEDNDFISSLNATSFNETSMESLDEEALALPLDTNSTDTEVSDEFRAKFEVLDDVVTLSPQPGSPELKGEGAAKSPKNPFRRYRRILLTHLQRIQRLLYAKTRT